MQPCPAGSSECRISRTWSVVAHVRDDDLVARARPRTTSKSSKLARPSSTGVLTARFPRTTNDLAPAFAVGERPLLMRSTLALRPVMTSTSTRRLDRSSGLDLSASATCMVMMPFWMVGRTLATVPSSVSSPTLTGTGRPTASRLACTSETVASTRNELEVGDARDDVALADRRALLGERPGEHARCGRPSAPPGSSWRRASSSSLRERGHLERQSVELGGRAPAARCCALGLELLELDDRLRLGSSDSCSCSSEISPS